MRKLALEGTEVVEPPGRRFHYNNFNPLLAGLALERAVGMPVASYLEARLWRPLGMEADGSWSLDSRRSGFEKMESGLNARAVDFARFGLLFARDGAWRGRQLVPRAWVREPTLVPTRVAEAPARAYQLFWWVQDDCRPRALFARGKYGQHLYVVPEDDLVLVRLAATPATPTSPSSSATWPPGWRSTRAVRRDLLCGRRPWTTTVDGGGLAGRRPWAGCCWFWDPGPARPGPGPGPGTGPLVGLRDRSRPWPAGARPGHTRPVR